MFISLSQLKIEVKKACVNSQRQYHKNRKKHWPSNPHKFYKNEWNSWSDLFGKEKVEFISLSQLKIEVKKAKINDKNQYLKNRKKHWPSHPHKFYKNEWKSWSDLFGKERIKLSQLKIEVRKAGTNSQRQYRKNRKKHWPSKPSSTYKNEWISWNNLFGKEKVEFISLSQLKVEVKKAGINSGPQYHKNRKKHWPSTPHQFYKNEWNSWNDLFGEEKAEYVSLSQLKVEVKKARINSSIQYHKNRKKHWPSTPPRTYKDEWISWPDLFGKSFNLKQYIVRKLGA